MKKSKMTKSKFINLLYDEGWDIAVKQCRKKTNDPNIKLLCDVYNTAYPTEGFQAADAPNLRLCYKIAEFAINNIIEQLDEK